jgi:hypothetical protein
VAAAACWATGSACAQGANGDAANGNTANGNVRSGDATNGDATNGKATNGKATNGDATNGKAANSTVVNVNAANGSAGAPVLASEIGHSTRGWLDLQRSGAAAAPALPMLGEEAGLAYQRYMDSFRTKIPASFGSSLNGNGNMLHVDYTNVGGASQN